jgi:hypothetical protein
MLIRSLESKQILTIANIGLRYRTQVQGRLPLFSSSGVPFLAALLFNQNRVLLDAIS